MTIRPSSPRPTTPAAHAPRPSERTARVVTSAESPSETVELSATAQAALSRPGDDLLGPSRFREVMAFLSPERQLDPAVLRDVAQRMAASLADETSGGV